MSQQFEFSDETAEAEGGPAAAVARAASEWVARRDRGLGPEEERTFLAWKAADPRHATAFVHAERAWRGLDGAALSPVLTVMADDVLHRARTRRARKRFVRLGGFATVAAATVAFGFSGWLNFPGREGTRAQRLPTENYRVIESTARQQLLPDGSTVELNGTSRIEVVFTAAERRVRLLEGEAHFVVLKDLARPFTVQAGQVAVRAIGTAFNVRLASETIEVLVTEGKVKLATDHAAAPAGGAAAPVAFEGGPALTVGHRAVIQRVLAPHDAPKPAVTVGEVDRAAIEQELGWQRTRLVFNNTPLDEVVAGFNRYNTHRLTLGDPKLRDRALTGVFRADNLEGFVRLLRASVDVKAEQRTPHETVLLPIR